MFRIFSKDIVCYGNETKYKPFSYILKSSDGTTAFRELWMWNIFRKLFCFQWNSKDDTLVELTIEDIQNIRLNLILGEIQKLWLVKQPYYKNLVEKATTVDDINAIVIDFGKF